MISTRKDIFFLLNRSDRALVEGKDTSTTESDLSFFEGDTQNIRIYIRNNEGTEYKSCQLGENEALALAITLRSSLSETEVPLLAYSTEFDSGMDDEGDVYYDGVLELNTQLMLDALSGQRSVTCSMELVIIDTQLSRQFTLQGVCEVFRSAIPPTALSELNTPSVNIGSYATVRELCEDIVDQRIIGLKDGAPAEFDTLYELAEAAMSMQSHRAEVGTFADYLEGKALADSGLTISELGQIVSGEASATVVP